MVAEYSDIDWNTACKRLRTVVQTYLDEAEELAYKAGEKSTSTQGQANFKTQIKPLATQWEREAALAYKQFFLDAAKDLQSVMNQSKSATELEEGLNKVHDELDYKLTNLEKKYTPM